MTNLTEPHAAVRFAALPRARADVLRRALARACDAGASAELAPDGPPERVMKEADVIVSLPWPVTGDAHQSAPVSYTHLTLPTIYSV